MLGTLEVPQRSGLREAPYLGFCSWAMEPDLDSFEGFLLPGCSLH